MYVSPYAVHGCGPFWFFMGWVEVNLVEVGLGISCGKVAVCGISPLMERLVAAGWVWCVLCVGFPLCCAWVWALLVLHGVGGGQTGGGGAGNWLR